MPPWLANIFVNAPGSDGAVSVPIPALETWEDIGGGAGVGETGPELPGALAPCAENIRVNSPGAELAGAPGLDSETWEGGGAGVGPIGAELPGALAPCAENIRVNSPGAEPAGAGATGLSAAADVACEGTGVHGGALEGGAASLDALDPIELNICVNAPGPDDPAGAGAPGPEFGTWETGALSILPATPTAGIPTVGSIGVLSIATGVKTRFRSSVRPVLGAGLALAPAPLPGIVSACSMRVNSPGLPEPCDGGAAGCSFTGSAAGAATGAGGAAAAKGVGAGLGGLASGAVFPGSACFSSEASKSSSARGAPCTWPNTPVALDGASVGEKSDRSNGFLGVPMRGHLGFWKIIGTGFQHYIDFTRQ